MAIGTVSALAITGAIQAIGNFVSSISGRSERNSALKKQADIISDQIKGIQKMNLQTEADRAEALARLDEIIEKSGDRIKEQINLQLDKAREAGTRQLQEELKSTRGTAVRRGLGGSEAQAEAGRKSTSRVGKRQQQIEESGQEAITGALKDLDIQKLQQQGAISSRFNQLRNAGLRQLLTLNAARQSSLGSQADFDFTSLIGDIAEPASKVIGAALLPKADPQDTTEDLNLESQNNGLSLGVQPIKSSLFDN